MKRVYLDFAATTPVDPRVREAMAPYLGPVFGNPSSIHQFGQEALAAVDEARGRVAALLNASPEEIVFTGGGTEANNAAVKGVCLASRDKGNRIVTTAVEHHAVLHPCEFMEAFGFECAVIPVGRDGLADPDDVKKALTPRTVMVSVMHANNEIGVIQPLAEIGRLARERGIAFHTDAVQTFGHLDTGVDSLGVDLLSLSGHKLYGPKGIGALYIRKGTPFVPLLHGGGQEAGRRSSTHNVPGIVGLGKAADLAGREMKAENERILDLRNRLYGRVRRDIDGVRLNGHPEKRLANNLNLSVEGVEGESLLVRMDIEGVAVSTGSACGSGSEKPSHVLTAIGLSPKEARGSIRLTLGRMTTQSDVDEAAAVLQKTVDALRSIASG